MLARWSTSFSSRASLPSMPTRTFTVMGSVSPRLLAVLHASTASARASQSQTDW